MRFNASNYEKAFPRNKEKPVKVEVVNKPGNVIEEAEVTPEPDPEPEIEDQEGPEDLGQEGAENGNE